MIRLIYGTGNPGKYKYMQDYLRGTEIELERLPEAIDLRTPPETGKSPLENARQKAEYYFGMLKRPVFSCDSGLVIEGLSSEEQPGVHVRYVDGRRLTDEEMTAHYAGIARRMGGRCRAHYQNAICLVLDEKRRYEYDGREICGRDFYLVDCPKSQKIKGFPLDPISVDIRTGKYFVEEANPESFEMLGDALRYFFEKALRGI